MEHINETINNVKTLDDLKALEKEINEMIDTRRRVINLVTEAHKLGNKSFGYIKESFENLSTRLYKTAEGKSVMKKYAEAVRENKSLSSLHKLYENIRKSNKNIDVDYFVNSICDTDWGVDKHDLNEGLEKLSNIVSEGYILVGEDAGKYLGNVNDKLDNAIEYIAENSAKKRNIVKYSEAVKILREAVENSARISDSFQKDDELNDVIELLMKRFGRNEDEQEAEVEDLTRLSGDAEKEVFNSKKEKCEDCLKEAIKKYEISGDTDEIDTLKNIFEQVSAKQYNPDTIGADITNFMEMTKLFEQ